MEKKKQERDKQEKKNQEKNKRERDKQERDEQESDKREKQAKRRAGRAQLALWVLLILLQMAVVKSLEVQAAQTPSDWETDAGQAVQVMEETVVYRQVEALSQTPETLEVELTRDGRVETVLCHAVSSQVIGERWTEDFSFPVTFHSYGADYYQLGDVVVASGEELQASGWGRELLETIGVPADSYEISGLSWSGEPYLDAEGVLCRDAEACGRRLVQDIQVRYQGETKLPEREETEGRELSAAQEEILETEPEPESETEIETEEEPAEERPLETEPEQQPEWNFLYLLRKLTKLTLIAVGIGTLLCALGLLTLLALRLIRFIRGRRK